MPRWIFLIIRAGNATAVVGAGDCADDARAAGAVLAHHAAGASAVGGWGGAGAQAAWFRKREATFADALALVRQQLWSSVKFTNSPVKSGVIPIPISVLHGLVDTLCYAA